MTKIWSYSKASVRLWRKQWVGVFVAVAGLAVAFAVSILAGLYVYDGIRSDDWLDDAGQIYRVNTQTVKDDGAQIFGLGARSMFSVAGVVTEQFANVEAVVRLKPEKVNVEWDGTERASDWVFADPSFPAVFPLTLVSGDISLAFTAPGSVALSRSEAQAYGGLDAIGSIINVAKGQQRFSGSDEETKSGDKVTPYKIVAIYEDLPPNTHLVLRALALYSPPEKTDTFQIGGDLYTYLKFADGTDVAAFEQHFTETVSPTLPRIDHLGISGVASLEPILGMQFNSPAFGGFRTPVKSQYLWVLGVIGSILLLTAGFNFANVFTAINLLRGKEMAVRRIVGAPRSYLGFVGLFEGLAITYFSFGLSFFIAQDLAPLLTDLTGVTLQFWGTGRIAVWGWAFAFAGLVGLVTAAYPTLVMSRPQPIDLLRDGQASVAGSKGRLKQALVGLQALAFVGTTLGALQIFHQIDHLVTRDQGYKSSDIIVLNAPEGERVQFSSSFRDDFAKLAGIDAAVATGGQFLSPSLRIFEGKKDGPNSIPQMVSVSLSRDLLKLMEIKPVAETDGDWSQFSRPIAIAERDLSIFGFKTAEEALGQIIERVDRNFAKEGKDPEVTVKEMRIVAVLPRFRGEPRFFGDAPYIYQLGKADPKSLEHITANVDLAEYATLLPKIEALWRDRFGDVPLTVFRYDEALEEKYENERQIGDVVFWVALITAILGFAGLYGMATHWLTSRERELALRRVMGASRSSVVGLALRKMLLPVGFGSLAAMLPTWLAMQEWGSNFSDFSNLGWYFYGGAILGTLALSGSLLFIQVQRALRKRPAHVLYHE